MRLHKHLAQDKIGISLMPGTGTVVEVRDVVMDGPAELAGIRAGDVIWLLNGEPCVDALEAARVLRESKGTLTLYLERYTPDAAIADREHYGGGTDATDLDDSASDADDQETWEWDEYLEWMIARIEEREKELRACQCHTADVLASSVGTLTEPAPPSEESMADPMQMEAYMEALASFQQQQQKQLVLMDVEAEENREATAALALLACRRAELEQILMDVEMLTDADADRVEAIWSELSYDGSCRDDGNAGDYEMNAQAAESYPSKGTGADLGADLGAKPWEMAYAGREAESVGHLAMAPASPLRELSMNACGKEWCVISEVQLKPGRLREAGDTHCAQPTGSATGRATGSATGSVTGSAAGSIRLSQLRCSSKEQLMAQRLQRARSSSTLASARQTRALSDGMCVKAQPWCGHAYVREAAAEAVEALDEDDEIGCHVHPI